MLKKCMDLFYFWFFCFKIFNFLYMLLKYVMFNKYWFFLGFRVMCFLIGGDVIMWCLNLVLKSVLIYIVKV